MKKTLWISFLVAATIPTFGGPIQDGRLVMKIQDSGGAVVANAHIIIHWDPSSAEATKVGAGLKEDLMSISDHDGEDAVSLPPGFYDIFIASGAFTPQAFKVRVWDGKKKIIRINLKADPQVTAELGDQF